ncbi:MAG: hypothetical protein GY852_07340, partial [bacterium]|nr:hypothetical protein [bacterium]
GTDFSFDKLELDSGMMDGFLSTVEFICGSVTLRTFLTLGELVWSLLFALIAAIPCLTGYAGCFVTFFQLFFWEIWPLLATFIQLTIGGIVITATQADLAAQSSPGLENIPEILLPAVMEATGFSIISLLLVAMITFTGIKAISIALGGEYILYGVSRFV